MMNTTTLTGQFLNVSRLLAHAAFRSHAEGTGQLKGRILAILRMKEEVTATELLYLLDVPGPLFEETLRRMERDGLLTCAGDQEPDQRIVCMTAAGTDIVTDTPATEEDELFACLSDEEKAVLGSYLQRIAAHGKDIGDGNFEKWMEGHTGTHPSGMFHRWGMGAPFWHKKMRQMLGGMHFDC